MADCHQPHADPERCSRMCNVHPFEVPCDECGETIVVTNASINVVGTYCSGCFGYPMCACNERHRGECPSRP